MQDARTTPAEASRERLGDLAFALLLVASVASSFRVPFLGGSLPNLVLPLASAVLVLAARPDAGAFLRRHALLLATVCALVAWTWLSAAASPKPETALRLALKSSLYAGAFVALVVRFEEKGRAARSLRAVLLFLLALALLGVVESLFPESGLFRLFRTERSLSIQPRISSILPWPNPYGILMVAGVALSEGMAAARLLAPRAALLSSLLFLTQVAQSGSRNAWAVAALVLVFAVVRAFRGRKELRAAGLAAFFAAGLFLLPVAAHQLRIERSSPVARALLPDRYVGTTSLADPFQSLSLRGKIWRLGLVCVSYQPFLGLGPGVFTKYATPTVMGRDGFNAHNLPLELVVDIGLPGLLLGLLALAALRPPAWLGQPAGGALLAILAGQLVDCFLYEPATVLVMLACAASVAAPRDEA
jgi:O-antigen ligase